MERQKIKRITSLKNETWFPLAVLVVIGFIYLVGRVAWYDAYPPTRNYDHFNTETALNTLESPDLYPVDPIWQNGGQTDSLGFIFIGFFRGLESLGFDYGDDSTWTLLYALHLLIFLPSATWFFNHLTRNLWLSALFAVVASLPFYFYFSFTNWGITSPYARTFVTVQAPGLFLALWYLLAADRRPWWAWIGFSLWVSSIIFWNPVNGLALIEIFGFALFIEMFARRISWREFALFIGITGGMFAFYYLSAGSNLTSTSDNTPLSDGELETLTARWVDFAGLHFFPWTVSTSQATQALVAVVFGSSLLTLSAWWTRGENLRRWWWVGLVILLCQLPPAIIFTRDAMFLLFAGYWLSRYQKIDRWDVLWLSLLCAVNLGSIVQDWLGYFLFVEMKMLSMASLAFESFRTIRWAFWLLFIVIARWCGDLLRIHRESESPLPLLAIPILLGSLLTRVGNVGIDDSIILRPVLDGYPYEDLRQWLVFAGMAVGIFASYGYCLAVNWQRISAFFATAGALGLGIFYIRHLPDAEAYGYEIGVYSWLIGGLLLVLGILWMGSLKRVYALILLVVLVIAPIVAYHRTKPNFNLSSDFDEVTVWTAEHVPNETLFLPLGFDPMPYRAQSERSVLAWDALQYYYFLGPRAFLENDSLAADINALASLQGDEFRNQADLFGVDMIVAPESLGTLPYPVIYDSGDYHIYYPTHPETRNGFYDEPTRGMSEDDFRAFEAYRETFDLVPDGEIILMPVMPNTVRRTEGLQALAWQLSHDRPPSENAVFDVMILLEKMRHPHEIELGDAEKDVIDRWNANRDPNLLSEIGIQYVLIDDRWWDSIGAEQQAIFTDESGYERVAEWENLASGSYYLYKIGG